MKIIIHKSKPWLLAFTVFGLSSCSDFLNESDPSNYTVDSYFTKPADARSSVNTIYASLRDPLVGTWPGGSWMMTEFATGQAVTDQGNAVDAAAIRELKHQSSNAYGLTNWTSCYKGIANANLSIAKIPTISMDATQIKLILGEAYFLRAWYYYSLVRTFGNVPLILEPVTFGSEKLKSPSAKPEEVFNQIVADLKVAEQAGLPWTDLTGKVSLGAVKSLLAQVYLTMAGYPLQKGAAYFDLAAQKAAEVIDSKQYKLFATYDDLHNPAKKNIEENIFMVQFKTGIIPGTWQQSLIPNNKNISAYSEEAGVMRPTPEFVKSFETGDLRVAEKQFFFTTFTNEKNRNQVVDLGGYFIYKYFDSNAHLTTGNSDLNWSLIRYAEILLLYAEAANEVSGPSTKVYDAVNAIRTRAQLAPLTGLTKDQLREAIWREKWHEMCFEGVTWFDMARLRKAYNLVTNKFEPFEGFQFTYGPKLTKRELLFPLPIVELNANNTLKQNEGF